MKYIDRFVKKAVENISPKVKAIISHSCPISIRLAIPFRNNNTSFEAIHEGIGFFGIIVRVKTLLRRPITHRLNDLVNKRSEFELM